MGTGIVFVVLAAIWVVYFVQYWARRREHLATARSVESFAEAMRVLERRPAVLRAKTGDRVSSAYAMSPTRVVSARPAPRPQVIAKPHAPTPSRQPSMPQRGGAPEMQMPKLPKLPTNRPAAKRRPTRPGQMSPSRKVRGLTLLAAMAATLVTTGLAAFSVLLWWVPLITLVVFGAAFWWLRSGVQSEIAARKAMRRRVVRQARRSSAGAAAVSTADAEATDTVETTDWTAPPELIETTTVVAEDLQQSDGWQPVPVPPPTYTLKAKAPRPATPDVAAGAGEGPAESGTAEPTTTHDEVYDEQRAAYGT